MLDSRDGLPVILGAVQDLHLKELDPNANWARLLAAQPQVSPMPEHVKPQLPRWVQILIVVMAARMVPSPGDGSLSFQKELLNLAALLRS
jgi:hypothetical protein